MIYAISVSVVVVLAAAAFVFFRWKRKSPQAVVSHALHLLRLAEKDEQGHPAKAEQEFAAVIADLEILHQRGLLKTEGEQALGNTHLERAKVLVALDRIPEAETSLKEAARWIDVPSQTLLSFQIERRLVQPDDDEKTLDAYIDYLALPASDTDPALVNRLAERLQKACRVDDGTPIDALALKVRLNQRLALLPITVPSLVIVEGKERGRHFDLDRRRIILIGREHDNQLVVDDESVMAYHAELRFHENHYTVDNALAGVTTLLQGCKIDGPTKLTDGALIQCGALVFVYYENPRPANLPREQICFNMGMAHYRRREYNEAIGNLHRALEIKPDNADALWYIGLACQAIHNQDAALKAFEKAHGLADKHPGILHSLGMALLTRAETYRKKHHTHISPVQEQSLESAMQYLKDAAQLAVNRADYFFDLSRACTLARKPKEGRLAVREALMRLIQPANMSKQEYLENLEKMSDPSGLRKALLRQPGAGEQAGAAPAPAQAAPAPAAEPREAAHKQEPRVGVMGNLADMSFPELIQVLGATGKSNEIRLTRADREVFMYIQNGTVVHASMGALQGDAVFYEVMKWDDGEFQVRACPKAPAHTITTPTVSLIMEGARLRDESLNAG